MTATDNEVAAAGDRGWFDDHPGRRYRIRRGPGGVCLIRRRPGGVLLRTRAADLPRAVPDTDKALRSAWVAAAWADLTPPMRDELAKEIKKAERINAL